MTSSATITLYIGNVIPQGNEKETRSIVELWQQLDTFFDQRKFVSVAGIRSNARPYLVSLDASSVLEVMEGARDQSQTFTGHRKAHIEDPGKVIGADLVVTVSREDQDMAEVESYQVAANFVQQLVLAANIVLPGSIQILDARFTGAGAHRFEAQNFDSKILFGAQKAARENSWPQLQQHSLETVWNWLEDCEVSHTHTAIKDVNKVLFTMLKVAEQRHEYSARTVLLIMYQLETLLDCRNSPSFNLLRNRARLVLGKIPEAADSFRELYEVRNNLFLANQPVHRPPLISHNTEEELREQIGQHNTAVELGTAIVLALLQDLIANGAREFEFAETFSRR